MDVEIIELVKYVAMQDKKESIFMKSMDNIKAKFEKDLRKKRQRNPEIKFKNLENGMSVEIRFNSDLAIDNVNFTVLPIIEL